MSEDKLFSDRNGRARGYTKSNLTNILWENVQKIVFAQGLLDQQFGYNPSDWDQEIFDADRIPGISNLDSRTILNRVLRTKADFDFSIRDGRFSPDHYTGNTRPDSLGDIDTMFDFLEMLHTIVSRPKRRANTEKHVGFSSERGRALLRESINDDLALYSTPYRMLENGQIVEIGGGALADIAEEGLALKSTNEVSAVTVDAIRQGISLYMKRDASSAEKKAALREVVAALESLKPMVKKNLLSKDENELFMIANNFAVRHQNSKQKSDYDSIIWYDWMFHVNLAALIAVIKIIQKQAQV